MAAPICTLHHHIGPESSFERGLGVASTRAAFEAQVARVSRDFDVIDLETLINGKLPKKPLLITFDDAFASVHDMAREVLAPAGLPSVFFVNPGLVGVPDLSLDSAIAYAANEHGVGELCRAIDVPERENIADLVVGDMARLGAVAREAVKARIIEAFGPLDLGPRAPLLTRNELAALADYGVEVGNHTTSHVHCRALNAAEIESEIVASKAMLEEMTQKKIRSFSVPYGHDGCQTKATQFAPSYGLLIYENRHHHRR